MQIKDIHLWNLSVSVAIALQKELCRQVLLTPLMHKPQRVAGLDCAFSSDKKRIVAAVVVLELPDFQCVETAEAVLDVTFPYVPGLLSFREAPACLAAMRKLKTVPDVVLVDGQGIAHPRRLGLASHLGLFLDIPTIGCAKSRLIGEYGNLPSQKGAFVPLMDKNEHIGFVVRSRKDVKLLFVSPGHKITHIEAVEVVLSCCSRYRLPEPARLAHQFVTRLRQTIA
jgi:deoxyribonuclease V